jgi:hypothetical protein
MEQNSQRKKARRVIDQTIHYQSFFATADGEKVLFDLMRTHHVIGSTFSKGDPYETAFKEGERNVVLRILSILKTDVDALKKRIEEGLKNEGTY